MAVGLLLAGTLTGTTPSHALRQTIERSAEAGVAAALRRAAGRPSAAGAEEEEPLTLPQLQQDLREAISPAGIQVTGSSAHARRQRGPVAVAVGRVPLAGGTRATILVGIAPLTPAAQALLQQLAGTTVMLETNGDTGAPSLIPLTLWWQPRPVEGGPHVGASSQLSAWLGRAPHSAKQRGEDPVMAHYLAGAIRVRADDPAPWRTQPFRVRLPRGPSSDRPLVETPISSAIPPSPFLPGTVGWAQRAVRHLTPRAFQRQYPAPADDFGLTDPLSIRDLVLVAMDGPPEEAPRTIHLYALGGMAVRQAVQALGEATVPGLRFETAAAPILEASWGAPGVLVVQEGYRDQLAGAPPAHVAVVEVPAGEPDAKQFLAPFTAPHLAALALDPALRPEAVRRVFLQGPVTVHLFREEDGSWTLLFA